MLSFYKLVFLLALYNLILYCLLCNYIITLYYIMYTILNYFINNDKKIVTYRQIIILSLICYTEAFLYIIHSHFLTNCTNRKIIYHTKLRHYMFIFKNKLDYALLVLRSRTHFSYNIFISYTRCNTFIIHTPHTLIISHTHHQSHILLQNIHTNNIHLSSMLTMLFYFYYTTLYFTLVRNSINSTKIFFYIILRLGTCTTTLFYEQLTMQVFNYYIDMTETSIPSRTQNG